MADEGNDQGEKTEEPSAHRIEQFRKRGEVASSKELTSVLVLGASILTIMLSAVYMYEVLFQYIEWLYSQDATGLVNEKMRQVLVEKTFLAALKCVGPVFLVVFCVSIFSSIAQVGFLFSTDVLTIKPERINPISGIKKLFTLRSIVEALKGILKFICIVSIVYIFVRGDLGGYSGYLHLDVLNSLLYAKTSLLQISFAILLFLLVIALGDFAYQKLTYRKKLMMTKQEAKKESKEQEGNPEIKQRIRTIQREMARKRMMSDVKKADVIITNPTHLSVALKYDSLTMISPAVIAKGADFIALRIREIAKENGIPIVENVPLARALYKTVKVNAAVPRTLYKAVAEVLAFVYKLRKKEKALGL